MNTTQLRMWLAAPMASLFLVLGLCAFVVQKSQVSIGVPVEIQKIRSHSPNYVCEDDRLVMVRIGEDGRLWINETGMTPIRLKVVLGQINEYRSEHVVYLMVSPSASYQQFIDTLSLIRASVPSVHVILITPRLQRYFEAIPVRITAEKLKEYPVCPLEWKENGFNAPSIYSAETADSISSPQQ